MKLILLSILAAFTVSTVNAASLVAQQHVAAGTMTNLIAGASGKISQLILTSAANDAGYCWFIDAPDKNYRYTNSAYYTYTKYATNLITTYTNFFGATNNITNVVLKTYTNTVAAATNNLYPVVLVSRIGTNVTEMIDGTYYFFNRGITVTNAGSGGLDVTIVYETR